MKRQPTGLPPMPKPDPWTGVAVPIRPFVYELRIRGGFALVYKWQDMGWIHAIGSRRHAEAKLERIVNRLNRRDAERERRDAYEEARRVRR